MIRIVDKTLILLDAYNLGKKQLDLFSELFARAGIFHLEVFPHQYDIIDRDLSSKFVIRVCNESEVEKHPFFHQFIGSKIQLNDARIIPEIHVNDIRESHTLAPYSDAAHLRISGLDDILLSGIEPFSHLFLRFNGRIELCPNNSIDLATATALEWLLIGQTNVVSSFGGIGGYAATEEILMALQIIKRYRPNHNYSCFQNIKSLIEDITGTPFLPKKPIIGTDIFDVEAGIHVNGIYKSPKNYEPFQPEIVGLKRRILVGKHSGATTVKIKLQDLGIAPQNIDIPNVLEKIKKRCIEKNCSLSDEDFLSLL